MQIQTLPKVLESFLKTIELSYGIKPTTLEIVIDEKAKNVKVNGSIKKGLGRLAQTSTFNVVLAASSTGQLEVIDHKVYIAISHKPFAGDVEGKIENLHTIVVGVLNNQICGAEVTGFQLVGDKLQLDVRRK